MRSKLEAVSLELQSTIAACARESGFPDPPVLWGSTGTEQAYVPPTAWVTLDWISSSQDGRPTRRSNGNLETRFVATVQIKVETYNGIGMGVAAAIASQIAVRIHAAVPTQFGILDVSSITDTRYLDNHGRELDASLLSIDINYGVVVAPLDASESATIDDARIVGDVDDRALITDTTE